MNTEQKAREWIAKINKSIAPTTTEKEAKEILIALLVEREAMDDIIERLSRLMAELATIKRYNAQRGVE